ncbi:3-hydroxyisobutyrate dehydrogenase [Eikenella sp. NML080894]|nr:3-hydroxyisobutyrate dehydrogenase [Eikenella sp. NML080894]OAM39973.1 3-hydroxyisobutyrate dehydrogenase [Eikenella sp. NML120348]OAM46107.1 3-hydroxyisobutyrate dehydrogenase [Eikenella sp. NML99-0057]
MGGLAAILLKKGGAKSLLKAGSAAALGMMAYQAYQSWQGGRQNNTVAALPEAAFAAQGQPAEERSRVILRTMIAAAASDGLIDEMEKQLIAQEGGADAELQQWLANEYARPASINELAEAVGGDQALAAEAYLVARAVCGDLVRGEIAFLSRLSQALGLDDGLVEQLELAQ